MKQMRIGRGGLALAAVAACLAIALAGCTSFDIFLQLKNLTAAESSIGQLPAAEQARAYSRLGWAYREKHELERAYLCFTKADNRRALAALADDFLKAGQWDRFVECRQEGGRETLINDAFADNRNHWDSWPATYTSIAGGKLVVRKTEGTGTCYVRPSVTVDPSCDFRIEAVLTRRSGSENAYAGIAFGIDSPSNNFQFGISGNGGCRYGRFEDNDWKPRRDPIVSRAIATGSATNTLSVLREGGTLQFSVNGTVVGSAPFETLPGRYVGISLAGAPLEVEVSSFSVEQHPSAAAAWTRAGYAALERSDEAAALRCFAKSGDPQPLAEFERRVVAAGKLDLAVSALLAAGHTERGARIRLAYQLAGAGKTTEALAQVRQAGWHLEDGFSRVALDEEFTDNARGWTTSSDTVAVLAVRDGVYHLETRDPRSTWCPIDLDPDADFKIEARMRKPPGRSGTGFSLIWGFADVSERQVFRLAYPGPEYGWFAAEKWKSVLSPEKSLRVPTESAENTLAVVRTGDRLQFFVNGTRVGDAPARALTGRNVGFGIGGFSSVDVDRLTVTEYAPVFAVGAARTERYASPEAEYERRAGALYLELGRYEEALPLLVAQGEQPAARICYRHLGEQAEYAGSLEAAAGYYRNAGDDARASAMCLAVAARAASGRDWAKAAQWYLQAGTTIESLRGLYSAYDALGQAEKAEDAGFQLAELLFAGGKPEQALPVYLILRQTEHLEAGAQRYLSAGSFVAAATLYRAAGNGTRERECYAREADRLALRADFPAAIEYYRKAGNESRAVQMAKKVATVSPLPGGGTSADVPRSDSAAGPAAQAPSVFVLRVTDSGGYSMEISAPRLEDRFGSAPYFDVAGKREKLDLEALTSASFNGAKKTVTIVFRDKSTRSLGYPKGKPDECALIGAVYQGRIACKYRIGLMDIRSLTRLDLGFPPDSAPLPDAPQGKTAAVVDASGVEHTLEAYTIYRKATYSTRYGWGPENGPVMSDLIRGRCLEATLVIPVAAGKATYDIPVGHMTEVSFKDRYVVTDTGLTCPLPGAVADLVAFSGTTPSGQLAVPASSISRVKFLGGTREIGGTQSSKAAQPDREWSLAFFPSASGKPSLTVSQARSEIYSPTIDWNAKDRAVVFRAALDDCYELGEPDESRTSMVWDKTLTRDAIPLVVGETCRAVPFALIAEMGMDDRGAIAIALKDGTRLQGTPYANWTGIVGTTPTGVVRVSRSKIPARVVFEETGKN